MYGEDLQLCADARREGWSVLLASHEPSVHVKGVSSGRPRSELADREFHRAMIIYYNKNLSRGAVDRAMVRAGVSIRLRLSLWRGARQRRRAVAAPIR
jgi:GT2 family glycosyltransferase